MALRITLGPDESVVVNGAVIKGDRKRTTISIHNKASVIRSSDILTKDEAYNVSRSAYFQIQMMIINNSDDPELKKRVSDILSKLYLAVSDEIVKTHILTAVNYLSTEDFYKALASLKPVVAYEDEVSGNKGEVDVGRV